MLEELLPTEELEIGILDPAVTQRLIAQVVHVLEKRQACHQPRRQRRAAGAIRIDRSELRLQKPPIDRARKLHQCMRQINDPIQPRAEQILLPGLLSLPRAHRSPSLDHIEGKESQPPIRRNRKNNLQENRSAAAQFRQKPLLGKAQSPFSFNTLEILHGRLRKSGCLFHNSARSSLVGSKRTFWLPPR